MRVLAELRDESRAVERREPGVPQKRPVQHGHVGVALEDLGVRADEVEVEVGEELVGVVAAGGSEDDGHLLVAERLVDVVGPRLR